MQVQKGADDSGSGVKKADYGLDAPGTVRGLAAGGVAALILPSCVGLFLRTTDPAMAAGFFQAALWAGLAQLLSAAGMVWSSRISKRRSRDRILGSLTWRGDEQVLDVGCGRGLFLIGAAKRLTTGRAVGVDVWQSKDLSGNTPDAALENARAEGVADRIEIKDGDARKLPFPDGTFDLALSSLAIHNIQDSKERATAIREMVRVLKPGGQFAIFDIFHPFQYAKVLRGLSVEDVRLSRISLMWCLPARTVYGRKR